MGALKITGAQPKGMRGVCYDSRKARRGSVFVALRGAKMDGHDYIRDAVNRGATTIVAEKAPDFRLPGRVTLVIAPDSRSALARLGDYFYDSPSEQLGVLGVTGTNGKTTVSYLLESVMAAADKKCGRIGTVDYDLLGARLPAINTTPESLDLQMMMRELVDRGADYLALEVSSHALAQSRVANILFRAGVFTNLTQDHLDYHGGMEDYFLAKAGLFTKYAPEVSVINADDPYASRLIPMIDGDVITYGLNPEYDVTAEDVVVGVEGISMSLATPAGRAQITSAMTGRYNVYNILAAASVAVAEEVGLDAVARGVAAARSVPGRFEKVDEGQPFAVIVDYAHTDDALANALDAARGLAEGRLITVFGCGGDRDRAKRPMMGRAAWTISDAVFVTSDNPRTEPPGKIIEDILGGVDEKENPEGRLEVIPDRGEAIRAAIAFAGPGDVVVIAGKGHEDYQIVGEKKTHFDDREEARAAIREKYGDVRRS